MNDELMKSYRENGVKIIIVIPNLYLKLVRLIITLSHQHIITSTYYKLAAIHFRSMSGDFPHRRE